MEWDIALAYNLPMVTSVNTANVNAWTLKDLIVVFFSTTVRKYLLYANTRLEKARDDGHVMVIVIFNKYTTWITTVLHATGI